MATPDLAQIQHQGAMATSPSSAYPQYPGQSQQRSAPLPSTESMPDLVKESINMVAPLTPQEIIRLRKELSLRQQAANQPLAPQAKPTTRVAILDLSPGATPHVIRISMSEGAIVSFIDIAGKPWKVEQADSFNTAGIDIALFGENGISIASKQDQAVGNVAVRLEGEPGAVTFKVISGHASTRDLDYSVQLQIQKFRPGGAPPVGAVMTRQSIGADELLNYLLRTPPQAARELTVEGAAGVLAWQTPAGKIILRTDKLVLSPYVHRRQSSADGVTVYEINPTPVALISDEGRMVSVQIKGFAIGASQTPSQVQANPGLPSSVQDLRK